MEALCRAAREFAQPLQPADAITAVVLNVLAENSAGAETPK